MVVTPSIRVVLMGGDESLDSFSVLTSRFRVSKREGRVFVPVANAVPRQAGGLGIRLMRVDLPSEKSTAQFSAVPIFSSEVAVVESGLSESSACFAPTIADLQYLLTDLDHVLLDPTGDQVNAMGFAEFRRLWDLLS